MNNEVKEGKGEGKGQTLPQPFASGFPIPGPQASPPVIVEQPMRQRMGMPSAHRLHIIRRATRIAGEDARGPG